LIRAHKTATSGPCLSVLGNGLLQCNVDGPWNRVRGPALLLNPQLFSNADSLPMAWNPLIRPVNASFGQLKATAPTSPPSAQARQWEDTTYIYDDRHMTRDRCAFARNSGKLFSSWNAIKPVTTLAIFEFDKEALKKIFCWYPECAEPEKTGTLFNGNQRIAFRAWPGKARSLLPSQG